MNTLRSGKEFWDEARAAIGYTSERGYDEKSLLHEPNEYKEISHTGRETEYGDYTMEVKFDVGCEDLSRKIREIALESLSERYPEQEMDMDR